MHFRESLAKPFSFLAQVNIATRTAALSPGATDPLSHFEGTYVTHYLPTFQGKKSASHGPELCIVNRDNSKAPM